MKKLIFVAGLVIGFVIGSRAGRGPYESLERTARQVAEDPEVQRRAAQAKETAGRVAQEAAETVKQKAPEVAETAKDAVVGAAATAQEKLTPEAPAAEAASSEPSTADAGGDGDIGEDRPLSS